MAKICALCGKGSVKAGKRKLLRGNYNPTGTIRKYPNLQWMRKPQGGRILVCVKCMKARAKVSREKAKTAPRVMAVPHAPAEVTAATVA